MKKTKLLVIGSPSLDKIHIKGKVYHSVGGAGMYVAMAAHRAGASVSLFGPRPAQIPDILQTFAGNLEAWMGPTIPLEHMPRFVIQQVGDKATYLSSALGAESYLDFSSLPSDLSDFGAVHITAMGDSEVQNAYFDCCRERGAQIISMGTWLESIKTRPVLTRELVNQARYCFMNEEEAIALFGSLGEVSGAAHQVLYITRAEKGAMAVLGQYQAHIPARQVPLKDPTGAGESFCGATLANILQGVHPVMAGMRGAVLAAEKVADMGALALMRPDPPPEIKLDQRVEIDHDQVKKVSNIIKELPSADPFDFISDYLPPAGHPKALDYFFATTLQQFSFWEESENRYQRPLIAIIDGNELKGSTYLYYAYKRALDRDPEIFKPERQAKMSAAEMADIFRADDGSVQMPALKLHLAQANQYGQDMIELGLTPHHIIDQVMESDKPLMALLKILDHIGGYKEDPIRKKSNLLALSLSQRPEKFLTYGEAETVAPVVDYHCMRSVLRIGLVEVVDQDLELKLANREVLSADEEWAVRFAAYQIQQRVEEHSGKPIGAVDWFFFNYMRSHCPEMTDPICEECALDPVCYKRKELFQPILRTTFY